MKNQSLFFLFLAFIFSLPLHAQKPVKNTSPPEVKGSYDPSLYGSLKWRSIGPFRGGRSLAVCGHPKQPFTFYSGSTGGGVWKTTNGGQSWFSLSDSTFHSSTVGSIAVAPSDPNIVYVGMGETEIRGNISFGDGMYKSGDGGKSWKYLGLKETFAIGRVVVHPQNPDIVYVAALGKVFGKNKERGIYRSRNGGQDWELILSKNDSTGAIDIALDPSNPSILFASLWQAKRTPYSLSSGGEGSSLYKSTDGGNTWKSVSQNPGMPKGLLGKIEIAISPANGSRVWAMIENQNGGLFRSDDGGDTWQLINTDKNLRQRPWYFSEITPDPKDPNVLYIMNVEFWKTSDGGKSFQSINVHHGDCHDLWVNPENTQSIIIGDDGGAEITFNGGQDWSEPNLPTAQFYHVSLDNDFPYGVYGAQQDNSTVKIASRTSGFGITANDWYPVAGGESGYVVPDPLDPDITYGGSYMGYLSKENHRTGQDQNVSVFPVSNLGAGAEEMKYRFQWTYPIVFSPHDPKTLYVTSQYVHKSTDAGMSWEIISPALTRGDTNTIKSSGGPITKDNTGAETYSTIFTFAESPVQKGVLWTGSDDGWVHVSQDGGKNWSRCTINGLPDWALMSIIEPSHFEAGTAYLAANRYKLDDTKPYLFKTSDFGKTWQLIANGIAPNAYCRVIREDPNQKGLLYAGTETGIYISFNDGASWQSLQLNLPLTPVHDIAIQGRDRDLVIATHGRSFWILDNTAPIYQLNDASSRANAWLFAPEPAYRTAGYSFYSPNMQVGQNAPQGVLVNYILKDTTSSEVKLRFFSEKGDTIAVFSNQKSKKGDPIVINKDFYQPEKIERPGILTAFRGCNSFEWDTRYPDATDVDGGALTWSGGITGPRASSGKYFVELSVKDSLVMRQPFEIKKDPRIQASQADLDESLAFQLKVRDKLTETNKGINQLRTLRKQINDYVSAIKDTVFTKELDVLVKPLMDSLQSIENALIQHDARAPQDLLALPIRLNDKLAGLASAAASADTRPTRQTYDAFQEITGQIDQRLRQLKKIIADQVPAINQKAEQRKVQAIHVE